MLLVATPMLLDPNFESSVVLLLESNEDGALGVILNRPTTVPVGDVLESWADLAADPGVLFRGGPVATDGALGLAALRQDESEPLGFSSVAEGVGIIDLDAPVDLVEGALGGVRIFAGYAGWDAEQLAGEIAEGSWYVLPAEPRDAFRPDVEELQREVLRRQPGELAWRSTRPLDPDLN